ncbi:hypothetical protein PFAG_01827 [Plasmodium falciparum Santa Lucia]|uniref:Uncharacterized protein n=10 Tax=Plasmodium falciparum TaxID=5833 RepID=Q8IBH4_PLAF7|nr:conserved protein, unknown function [Plasmodium falciparum 3D7]ETW19295.1 hypothetical protein PFFVO_01868 [Plasmodium falciparum Vietnam Oak-Knoll (FVO)]ETW43629.1 hypothetical protein PFNF135_01990 [Plasmodium falciparum NF135/5.C10]ETW50042.1 hypothetical protein PFMALIP_01905 [Plasmodium falciparum MaliPS096_E11]ETW57002.1 hypothetical protein PFUGPA_01021 [Plasmodium falciparum Palo Alto/Uganda]EUT87925.1 hypothetical protein PFAG_01827 [Plasmodium falciparum Santa Lucia]EWC77363.1 hy|eukprot:XP_001349180.1 conserved Plasmodium protein, unknown function [Plasmodium falciparum 3D7]
MGKGAVHPNGSNFCRFLKYNIVDKMRTLVNTNLYDTPRWLEWSERAPPMEIYNISLKTKYNNNKYMDLVKFLLKKYPHLRFQDCYVEGNNNIKGYDYFRNDHIITQMATHQLYYMNRGYSKKEALEKTEKLFYDRRMDIEKQQKINMCLAIDEKVKPIYTNGYQYLYEKMADNEKAHLSIILKKLRNMKEKLQKKKKGANENEDKKNGVLT